MTSGTAIGVDVGATKIAAARVAGADGTIEATLRVPTAPHRGPAAVLADCTALVARLAEDTPPAATGVAICELVDAGGRLRSAETVDWRELDLAEAFGAPVHLQSDVRAAALAEARVGAGREERDFLYVGVGSGVSHCLVIDGHPRLGARGAALITGAPPVERWSGGLALARRTGHGRAESALVDAAAATTVADAARRLGATLAVLVNALDPAALIVGGGLGRNRAYRERMTEALRAAVYDPDVRCLPVRAGAVGEAAAVGAALAALDAATSPTQAGPPAAPGAPPPRPAG